MAHFHINTKTIMAKKLTLEFSTTGSRTIQFSLDYPLEGLTLEAVQKSTDKIIPVLMTSSGETVTALKSACYTTTDVVKII